MATDPVSAFLTGFRAVDQYETNKLNREFARERQSRLKTLWERDDELWARKELEYKQQQRMQQLEAYSADLMDELAKKSELEAYQPVIEAGGSEQEARDAQGKWLSKWYGDDAEDTFYNEVLRRWGQADPTALEDLVLSHGRDPKAGPLVADRNPVANVGILPPHLSGDKFQFFAEYNRKDGRSGPATKFRTDRPNDPIDFITANTASMVKFFGPGFMTSKTPMIMRLRELLGAQEGALKGDPRGTKPEDEEVTTTAGAGGATPVATGVSNNTLLSDEEQATLSRDEQYRLAEERRNAAVEPAQLTNTQKVQRNPEVNAFLTEMDLISTDETTNSSRQTEPVGVVGSDTRGNSVVRNLPGTLESRQAQKDFTDEMLLGAPDLAPTPTTKEEVPKDSGVNLPNARKEDTGGTPAATEQDAPAKAAIVAEASKSKRRVPFRHELYNAASLVEGGYMSEEDFQTFARTGSMPTDTETQLFNMGNGMIVEARKDALGNVDYNAVSFGQGQGGGQPSVQDQRRAYDLLKARTDLLYEDHPEAQANFISSLEEAYNYLGLPSDNSEQLAQSNLLIGLTQQI
jgi:hypothetical protein